ncbi:MAG TPA: endonuclease III [Phycisphaerae bacterium]|nr:endonuclease III [Phycisphaerae bacterium]
MTARRPPRVHVVLRRLEKVYGKRPWKTWGKPLDLLIGTILSQNTNDRNSHAAMERLEQAFPEWGEAADAPLWKIAGPIRIAGLHRQKARSIRGVLRRIREERGRATLDFLRPWPTERIRDYLLDLPGVGPKTAACVLLFSLKRPVLPVDTHVHRVSRRLGLIGPKVSAEKAHDLLPRIVPPEKVYAFHVLLIQHGRQVCHARRPDHAACVLRDLCPALTPQ